MFHLNLSFTVAGGQVPQDRATTTQQDVVAEHEDEDFGCTCDLNPDLCDLPNSLLLGRQLYQEVEQYQVDCVTKDIQTLTCIHQQQRP